MFLLKYFWVSFWNIFMCIHRDISCVFFMIYVKDNNIDTPVSPSSPENVGAGQVIVPGESGLVTGVALQSGALEVWSDHYITDITTDNRSFRFRVFNQSERSMMMVYDQWECSPLLACGQAGWVHWTEIWTSQPVSLEYSTTNIIFLLIINLDNFHTLHSRLAYWELNSQCLYWGWSFRK